MVARTVGYILAIYRTYKEGNQWVSECPQLGTSSCGDTLEEALENIQDATVLYLNTIEQQGERERVFKERRIALYTARPTRKGEFPVLHAHPEETFRARIEKVAALV